MKNSLQRISSSSTSHSASRPQPKKNQSTTLLTASNWVAGTALAAVVILTSPLGLSGCSNQSEQADQGDTSAAAPKPAAASAPTKAPAPEPKPVCNNCGSVTAITPVSVRGETTGGGAVLGAIVGGVIGHQFGSGSGNDAATAAGAAGGAIAGNEIESRQNTTTQYEITVALDSGGARTILVTDTRGLRVGEKVTVQGNNISRR